MNSQKPIRVLVVDDSAFMRKAISNLLSESQDFVVVDTAKNGEDALQKVSTLDPDVMTLDVDMPGMNGLTVLERVMKEHPLPVVMVSSLTEDGTAVTIRALELGAVDFIPKHLGGSSLKISEIREPLHEKVRIAGKAATKIRNRENLLHAQLDPSIKISRQALQRVVVEGEQHSRPQPFLFPKGDPGVVVIGCSTGGPQALQVVLTALPSSFPIPIVVAQHMPKYFTKPFAERLNQLCQLEVREAQHGDQVKSGRILIAPGGQHMTLRRHGNTVIIQLSDHPVHVPFRPSVDVLMESAAILYGDKVLGLIMTGMGQDGLEGARAIKQAKGKVLAQDEASCIVYGMPKAVTEHDCADKVVSLQRMAAEIESWVNRQVRCDQPDGVLAGATTTP